MSLTENPVETLRESPELTLAIALLSVGLVSLFAGIIAATTGVLRGALGFNTAVEVGGVIAGISIPLLITGLLVLFPSTRSQKLGAGAGFAIALIGVVLFVVFFPNQWFGDTPDYTPVVALLYAVGTLIMMVYLFLGVANLQTQPEPDSRRSRRPAARSQQPKSGVDVFKSILTRNVGGNEEDIEVELDLEKAKTALLEDMNDELTFIEEVEVDEDDRVLLVTRADDQPHARFATAMPSYAQSEEHDGTDYRIRIKDEAFYVAHPDKQPTADA